MRVLPYARRQAVPQRRSAVVKSLSAPVLGWNARDALADMKPGYAVKLENWVAAPNYCYARKGFEEHATSLPDQVCSLMEYSSGSTVEMWAVSGGKIYDATASGDVGSEVVSGLNTDYLQYENVTTAGGSYMYVAGDGGDKPYLYDGSTWTAIDDSSTPAISGVTTTGLTNPVLFKTRIFFIEKNTLKAWYLPSGAISGSAASVDMSAYARRGGSLKAVSTWTLDAGYGVDDLLVFVTTRGEIIVWRGTDPSSASTWAMIGVWQTGSPIGRRCFVKWGGDLLLLTTSGLMSLTEAMQSLAIQNTSPISDKIRNAIAEAIASYGSNDGWEIFIYPADNLLILNVPISSGLQEQYVMHLLTEAWSHFTGIAANCWNLHSNIAYFGGGDTVYKAFQAQNDNGADIQSDAIQAFSYLGSHGRIKRFGLIRPILRTTGSPNIRAGINVDYDVTLQPGTISAVSPSTVLKWGIGKWGFNTWGTSDGRILNTWQGVSAIGYAAAPRITSVKNGGDLYWISSDISYENGGII